MKNINVLLDGLGGDVGQGVAKSLQKSKLPINIYGSCISITSSWLHKIKNSFIFPYINDDHFIPFLIDFINKHDIKIYFPTVDRGIKKIAQNKELIEKETSCTVFVDDIKLINICDDKFSTIDFLLKNNFAAPLSIIPYETDINEFLKKVEYPFIAKSRHGNGALNVHLIRTANEISPYIGNQEYMFQQYIPQNEGEFTSGIYLGDDNEIKGICTFKRELKCGSTYKAERIVDPNLEEPLCEMAKKLGLKYLNVQSMLHNGKLYPFEFNGRFSGTTYFVSRIFNAPEMFIRERIFNEKIKKVNNNELFKVMRYSEEVFVTSDDMKRLNI